MAQSKYKNLAAVLLTVGGLIASVNHAAAGIVTLNFDSLDLLSTTHGPSIIESGYTLTTSTQIRSVKPGVFNTMGTTSIFTSNPGPLTITQGPLNNLAFDIISMDIAELFDASTPTINYSGVKGDGSTVSGRFVASGLQAFQSYHLLFGSTFTNLVSFALSNNSAQYQIDNIELSSAFTITDNVSPNPLPATLPMFALGALSFFIISRRKRKA